MIDSFSDAAEHAEEALRDPGGLRFTHVPSLVGFVAVVRAEETPVDWSPAELRAAVRLDRLLWELGLRAEAERLFEALVAYRPTVSWAAEQAAEHANALAAIGTSLGLLDQVRLVLQREAKTGSPAPLLRAATLVNLAAVDLHRGDRETAARHAAAVESLLAAVDPVESRELRELLATVRLHLAGASGTVRASRRELTGLAVSAGEKVRSLGDNSPRAFLSVANLAVARVEAALSVGDARDLESAVKVLEVASQRLAALLGADHPKALGVQADLAAAQVESARAARSPDRLGRAVGLLESVVKRLESRLGPEHPRSVAAVANLVAAQVELVRAVDEPGKAQRTAEALAERAWLTGRLLGEAHPVTRLVHASSATCRRIALGEESASGGGSTLLLTHTETSGDWATEGSVYRSFRETMQELSAEPRSLRYSRRTQSRPGAMPRIALNDVGDEEAFLAAVDETIKYFNDGDLVNGIVVHIDEDEVLVDIGYRTEGVILARELSTRHHVDPHEVVAVGDEIEAIVVQKEDKEGRLILSRRRALYERAWPAIEKAREEDGIVTGTVIEVVKGGLILDIGLRGFLPASLVEMRRVRDLQPYVGKELEAKIIELDKSRNNVVLSRRAWLEQTQSEVRQTFLTTLQKGQIRSGVVSSILNFGVFVDLGGVDGLVHVSELSWKRVDHPSEVVEVGQEVIVQILDVDMDRERVSLSLKATQEDPLEQFARTHQIGQVVPGKVTKLVPFGAFVRVDEDIEGLVHISELAERHVEIPEQVVQVNDEIFVKVVDIDLEGRRVSLSVKKADETLGPDPAMAEFDPALYGMAASYDDQGNYIYPEGFDAETGDWLEGYEVQREVWENQYAEARQSFEQHRAQVITSREADAQEDAEGTGTMGAAPAASGGGGSYSSESDDTSGALASDEAIAALREKLAGGQS